MDNFLSVIGDLNIRSDMGSDSSLTLRNMLEGLSITSAFKSVTHNQDGQLDYVLMKTGINAAKYVAGSFKKLYSDHKSLFLRIFTDDDDVATTSSRVIDAEIVRRVITEVPD